ncbi:MAG: transposase [Planctomycetota bacterium]
MLSETSNSTAEVALSTEQRLLSVIAERDATIEAQRVLIVQLRADFELLTRQVKQLLASRGSGHSIAEGQLTFFGAKPSEEEAPDAEPQPEYVSEAPDGETPDDSIKRRNKPKRLAKKLDVSALPRETVTHELPESERVCPATGVELVPVGVKVSEEIEYSAAQIRVIEHRRIKYGPAPEVAKERQIDLLITPLPPQVLEGCRAGPRLLAQIVVQKYMHHLPLYRQEEVFQQAGLWIPRQTLCDWVLGTAFQLRPIADELMRQIRAGPVFQLDDTPIKCRGPKGSGYFQAYLWTFANPEVSGVAFRFTPGRAAKLIEPMLEDFNGYLVGDGYSGHFAAAREAGGDIVHGGCFAHVLRKFRDAEMESRRMARLYMSDISALYDIEDEATEARLSLEERVLLRRKKARSVLARMLRRTRGWKDLYSTSGKMGEAIKYLLNQWSRLKCFLRDGLVPLDNNACERAIRPIAVGRRNWLFAGSERGGEAAAICYSVIGSCRAAGVDPFEYLADVLIKVATYPASQIADLVPARWAELRAESGEA